LTGFTHSFGDTARARQKASGYYLNLPLARSTGDGVLELDTALTRVSNFGADVLVIGTWVGLNR
jgi:hypothetical protein